MTSSDKIQTGEILMRDNDESKYMGCQNHEVF